MSKKTSPKNISRLSADSSKPSAAVTYVLWFLVVAILSYIILNAWNPTLVQNVDSAGKPTGTANVTRVLIGSVIIGLIVVLLVWAVRRARA